jgi:hypothetical protein
MNTHLLRDHSCFLLYSYRHKREQKKESTAVKCCGAKSRPKKTPKPIFFHILNI